MSTEKMIDDENFSPSQTIKKLRRMRDLTQAQAAALVGIHPQTWSRYERGDIGIDQMMIDKITEALSSGDSSPGGHAVVTGAYGYIFVPHFKLNVSAGAGSFVEESGPDKFLAFSSEWIHNRLRVNPFGLQVVHAWGDSMAPTILDGDALLVDTAQKTPIDMKIYVIRLDGACFVKRLKVVGKPPSIDVVSDCQAFPTFNVSFDYSAFDVIGRVVWIGRTL